MNAAQHTPGELALENCGRDGWKLRIAGFGVIAHLGAFDAHPEVQAQQTANAHRLHQCWNTHAKLVAALKSAKSFIDTDRAVLKEGVTDAVTGTVSADDKQMLRNLYQDVLYEIADALRAGGAR